MTNEPTQENGLRASNEQVAMLAERVNLDYPKRIDPRLVEHYIIEQFGAWQIRKKANDEPHPDSTTKFKALPSDVQQFIARLAEVRLAVLSEVFTAEAVRAVIDLGNMISTKIQQEFAGDVAAYIAQQKQELAQKIEESPMDLPDLDLFESLLTKGPVQFQLPGDTSVSDVFEQIHHGLWLANLDKAHEFAWRFENMPSEPVIKYNEEGKIDAAGSRPFGHRLFSRQADLIGLVGQLVALSDAVVANPNSDYIPVMNANLIETPFLKDGAQVFIKNLDAKAKFTSGLV